MDLDSLSYELNLYEKGDFNTLERILTPSQTNQSTLPSQLTLGQTTLRATTNNPTTNAEDSEEVSIITSQEQSSIKPKKARVEEQESEPPALNQSPIDKSGELGEPGLHQPTYPPLPVTKRNEISINTKKWIKIDTTLCKLKEIERELKREKRVIDKQLLEDIETYGLKDITKGSHQLIPRLKKGRKKTFTKHVIHEKLRDFLNTMDVTDEVDELVIQATDYLDNTREKAKDTFELKHVRVAGRR